MGYFTLTGVITDFTPYPVAKFSKYQVILEPIDAPQVVGQSFYSTIAVGKINVDGEIVAEDGVSPFQAWTEDGLLYAFRTLPELFPRVVFDPPADGTILTLADLADIEVPGTLVPFPATSTITDLIEEGDEATLTAAKAYTDATAAAGFIGVNTHKITVSDSAPANPQEGDLWVDTSA
jgi:hypothetical protein